MTEYLVRFLVGGVVVSAFAMLGDVIRPKSFAGLFGAAPSVALATLGIAIYQHGAGYAALQSQTMMAGAIALASDLPVEPAVEAALPGWTDDRVKVDVEGGRLTVRLRPPSPLASVGRVLEVSSTAWVPRPEDVG